MDAYALGRHPEWHAIDQRGQVRRMRNLFAWVCLNTPYREYALQQVEEISSRYDVDGFWVDMMPIVLDGNTIGWNWSADVAYQLAQYPAPCYCEGCREKFRQKFGRDIPLHPTEEERIIGYQFLLDTAGDFLQEFRTVVHRYRPEALIMYNAGGSPEDAINDSDANCTEALAPDYSFQSFMCRWMMSHGKAYEIITCAGLPYAVKSTWSRQSVLFDHWTQKPPELLQLETSIAAAHAGNTTLPVLPLSSGEVEQGQYPAYGAAFGPIEQMEPYLKGVQKACDVGLLVTIKPYQAPHRWADMMEGARSFAEALLQGHFQYDVAEVCSVDDLGRYPLAVLANQLTMSDEEAERIRAYVAQGGNLIVTGATSLYDETGRTREDFSLADVMGVHYQGKIEDHFTFVRLKDPRLSDGIPDVPILVNQSPLSLRVEGGAVLDRGARPQALRTEATHLLWANPGPDDTQPYPLVVLHEFGQGRCLTSCIPLDTRGVENTWQRYLAMNMVDVLLGERSLTTDAPPGVEVVWNRQGQRSILHLINHQTGDPDRLSTERNKLTLRGIQVRLALTKLGSFSQVRTLADGASEVSYRSADGWLEISVPPFSVHAALVIE